MSKNTHWTAEDLKQKGLVQNEKGDYVKVSSLVAQGKVEKLPMLTTDNSFKVNEAFENAKIKAATKTEVIGNNDTIRINIKPLTQNRAWKGRRFKSDQYKVYIEAVSLLLPYKIVIPEGLLRVYYEFGMSTNSDFDNPCKMFTDILQAKYRFNDRYIMEAHIKKVIVKKGEEYISFKIESF